MPSADFGDLGMERLLWDVPETVRAGVWTSVAGPEEVSWWLGSAESETERLGCSCVSVAVCFWSSVFWTGEAEG